MQCRLAGTHFRGGIASHRCVWDRVRIRVARNGSCSFAHREPGCSTSSAASEPTPSCLTICRGMPVDRFLLRADRKLQNQRRHVHTCRVIVESSSACYSTGAGTCIEAEGDVRSLKTGEIMAFAVGLILHQPYLSHWSAYSIDLSLSLHKMQLWTLTAGLRLYRRLSVWLKTLTRNFEPPPAWKGVGNAHTIRCRIGSSSACIAGRCACGEWIRDRPWAWKMDLAVTYRVIRHLSSPWRGDNVGTTQSLSPSDIPLSPWRRAGYLRFCTRHVVYKCGLRRWNFYSVNSTSCSHIDWQWQY